MNSETKQAKNASAIYKLVAKENNEIPENKINFAVPDFHKADRKYKQSLKLRVSSCAAEEAIQAAQSLTGVDQIKARKQSPENNLAN